MSEKISKLLRNYSLVSGQSYKQLKGQVKKMSPKERHNLYSSILTGKI